MNTSASRWPAVASLLFIASCAQPSLRESRDVVKEIVVIDASLPRATLQQPGWGYGRVSARDLDSDGTQEQVVVIADVELDGEKLLWEDAHVWQVYVEEPDGTRTYVYSRRVPMGHVHVRFTAAAQQHAPALLLLEQAPHRLGVYEVRYSGPGQVSITELINRELQPGASTGTPEP